MTVQGLGMASSRVHTSAFVRYGDLAAHVDRVALPSTRRYRTLRFALNLAFDLFNGTFEVSLSLRQC